jgi:FkbM family methyltransferase
MPSQHGEEKIISGYFPPDYVGTAVEVGAGDGVHMSTTLFLEERGWKVLCIEPNTQFSAQLQASRKLAEFVACSDHDGDGEQFLLYDYPGAANHGVVGVLRPLTHHFKATFLPALSSPPTDTTVSVRRLTTLLEKNEFTDLDFLSIDVDGLEFSVLRGLDFDRWKPKVLLIENPFENGQMISFLSDKGYYRDHARIGGYNDIFVRTDA